MSSQVKLRMALLKAQREQEGGGTSLASQSRPGSFATAPSKYDISDTDVYEDAGSRMEGRDWYDDVTNSIPPASVGPDMSGQDNHGNEERQDNKNTDDNDVNEMERGNIAEHN